jgi:hypothetical protein
MESNESSEGSSGNEEVSDIPSDASGSQDTGDENEQHSDESVSPGEDSDESSDEDFSQRKRKIPFAKRQQTVSAPVLAREALGLRSRQKVNYSERAQDLSSEEESPEGWSISLNSRFLIG